MIKHGSGSLPLPTIKARYLYSSGDNLILISMLYFSLGKKIRYIRSIEEFSEK